MFYGELEDMVKEMFLEKYPDLEALYIVNQKGYRKYDDISGLKISYLMNDNIQSDYAWDSEARHIIGEMLGLDYYSFAEFDRTNPDFYLAFVSNGKRIYAKKEAEVENMEEFLRRACSEREERYEAETAELRRKMESLKPSHAIS